MIEKPNSEYEKNLYVASDDENYIPAANNGTGSAEDSGIDQKIIIGQEEDDSDESVEG